MQNQNKRQNCLSWDETLMQMARLIAKRSKDPNTQNGACIVDKNNVIVGLGYNGFPRGCADESLPWGREGDFLDKKYAYVVHAEVNAIYNANQSVKGCKLYCTLFPCNECAKSIIQTGITEIIYESDKYHEEKEWVASRRMLNLAGISYRAFQPKYNMEFVPMSGDKNEVDSRQTSAAEIFDISRAKGFGQKASAKNIQSTNKIIFTDIFSN